MIQRIDGLPEIENNNQSPYSDADENFPLAGLQSLAKGAGRGACSCSCAVKSEFSSARSAAYAEVNG